MLAALWRLRRQESWTRRQIVEHQAQALHGLRSHAYAHSSFYQRFHAGLTERPLQELPVLTKEMLHNHFDEIVTDSRLIREKVAAHVSTLQGAEQLLDRYFAVATSGTTGSPSFLIFNRREWATVLASFTRYERHIGSLSGIVQRPRIAVVASKTPSHVSARIGASTRSSLIPMLRLDVGAPLDSIVQRLNEWQPQMLATYASMTGILAQEQLAGRLQIAPRRIVSSAEVLTPPLRQRIEATWGPGVLFDQYGASEGGTFAVECTFHRGLHVFEDLVILEVVDQQNHPVPPGEYGDKVLLTVLFNHTQPLIRYELSDSIAMSTKGCSCGCEFALIDKIQGRMEDVLALPARNGGTVPVHPMVFYRILDEVPVLSWQVVQEEERLSILLSGDRQQVDEKALVERIQHALIKQGAANPYTVIQWKAGLARGTTGKAARIRSHLGPSA
ncbi:phenylacetate--CoA ligase family protein [bacterium]|nr:phenylacetate--CoA ligase family protein [bacterium]